MSLLYQGRNLVLCGLPGSGKTRVGQLLAERLGRPFVDTDALVEAETGQPIPDVFAEHGERVFRDLESEAIRGATASRGQVIAVGGGALGRPGNATALRATGDLVWLDGDPDELARRLAGEQAAERPLLANAAGAGDRPDHDALAARISELRRERDADYRYATATRIDTTGRSPDEIAEEVLLWARQRSGLLAASEQEQ